MRETNRRDFLKASAGAAFASPAIAASRLSSNDRIRVAVIGVRGRGRSHIQAFHDLSGENVEIVYLCDVDSAVLEQRAAAYEKTSGKKVKLCQDMRQILDDKSVHAVSFATPDHWHARGTIWACQAGKDIYVETPGTHNFAEGKKIIEAANKYRRIAQHGAQHRSNLNIVEAIARLNEGVIGRVYMARGAACRPGASFAQGVHELDIMRWGLGLDRHPVKIVSVGVHPGDEHDAPQAQSVSYEYASQDVLMTFEARGGLGGLIFTGTEGYMILPDYSSYHTFLGKRRERGPRKVGVGDNMDLPHFANFIQAVRSGSSSGLNADVEQLHLSSSLAHFANIAYRTGRMLQFDSTTEKFTGDEEATRLLQGSPYVIV
jgi:predicted dehydrogenase